MAEYEFKIRHVFREENVNADYLLCSIEEAENVTDSNRMKTDQIFTGIESHNRSQQTI